MYLKKLFITNQGETIAACIFKGYCRKVTHLCMRKHNMYTITYRYTDSLPFLKLLLVINSYN